MNINKFYYVFMALASCIAFSACSLDNSDPVPQISSITASFEYQKVNEDGFWIGEKNNKGESSDDGFGGTITQYPNEYVEGTLKFPINYSVSESSWGESTYWSGFAISARTEDSFSGLALGQYNNVVGKAKTGNKFCVVTTYGEEIEVMAEKGAIINYLYYTNSAYTVNCILNDGTFSKKFDDTDWLKCTIIGTHLDGTTAKVEISLAQGTNYVNEWQKVDLAALGIVKKLSFEFDGSDKSSYGLNTPAYICLDDINYTLVQ